MSSHRSIRFSAPVSAGIAVCLLVAPAFARNDVRWNPREIVESIVAGDTRTMSVSFTSNVELSNVDVWVVPEIAGHVQVTPTFFDQIAEGETKVVEITLSTLPEEAASTFEGTVHLLAPERTLSRPLPIVLEIGTGFFERRPTWSLPDPAVSALNAPDRTAPGQSVALTAVVTNASDRNADAAEVVFRIDDSEIGRVPVGPLAPGASTMATATWLSAGPGRHWLIAELDLGTETRDRAVTNNSMVTAIRVAGEMPPEPELEFEPIAWDALPFAPGEDLYLPVNVRNPSYADIAVPVVAYLIDGERIPAGGDDVLPPMLELPPGEARMIVIPWENVTAGQHTVGLELALTDDFPDFMKQNIKIWQALIPGTGNTYPVPAKDKWASKGPRLLYHGSGGLPSGSTGRVDLLAFHPTNANVIYAAAPSGGLWSTIDRGDNWSPRTDQLPTLNTRAVALDPVHPQIVYLATVNNYGKGEKGVFKSVDGGVNWYLFAPKEIARGIQEFDIRHTASGEVLIYAATDRGVLRYKNTNPWETLSTLADWEVIKTGNIRDLAVSPTDDSLVYASVAGTGLYRTSVGETATGDADWTLLSKGPSVNGLPVITNQKSLTVDIYKGNPVVLYAAVTHPLGVGGIEQLPKMGVYFSVNGGDSWSLVDFFDFDGLYNPFVRVHPSDVNLIYFGGVKLFKYKSGPGVIDPQAVVIKGIHDDMKSLEFDPFSASHYWVTNDGGVWRCQIIGAGEDACTHRNNDLRTIQFFDFDVSKTNQWIMVGGTQDNGTISYEGDVDWDSIRGGDGNYALIASTNNQILYAQHQFLRDTARCEKGGSCWWADWKAANGVKKAGDPPELPAADNWRSFLDGWNAAYITSHPSSPNYLLSQGPEVYATFDGGLNWAPKGPSGSNVKGDVNRVVVQPVTFDWIAGTSQGQIWKSDNGGTSWTLIFEHPFPVVAPVWNLAFAPTDYKVLYATFDIGGNKAYTRIWRLTLNPGPPAVWSPSNITDNLSEDVSVRTISGDGYDSGVAYVGTTTGVYRWVDGEPTWKSWQPYNDGLPLVDVRELLVDPTSKELRAATWGRGAWAVLTGP